MTPAAREAGTVRGGGAGRGWHGVASGAAHQLPELGRAVSSPAGRMRTRAPEKVPVRELHRHQGTRPCHAPGLHLSYGLRKATPDALPRPPTSLHPRPGRNHSVARQRRERRPPIAHTHSRARAPKVRETCSKESAE